MRIEMFSKGQDQNGIDIIAICMFCKKLRDKSGNWHNEDSIPESVFLSHTFCNSCGKREYPQYIDLWEEDDAA